VITFRALLASWCEIDPATAQDAAACPSAQAAPSPSPQSAVPAAGSNYAVSISAQPSTQTCSAANASGVATTNVANIVITCTQPAYTVSGSLHGLVGTGLVLANGSDSVAPAATATSFTFPAKLPTATGYSVTVQSQPTAQDCQVSAASGTITNSNVTDVAVGCVSGQWQWTTVPRAPARCRCTAHSACRRGQTRPRFFPTRENDDCSNAPTDRIAV
jgi:hypothetical protein